MLFCIKGKEIANFRPKYLFLRGMGIQDTRNSLIQYHLKGAMLKNKGEYFLSDVALTKVQGYRMMILICCSFHLENWSVIQYH